MNFSSGFAAIAVAVAMALPTSGAAGNSIAKADAIEQLIPAAGSTNRQDTQINVYLTGYSFWDNTPPGSAQIARPVLHRSAGGSGTYKDPVTLAVGHARVGSRTRMDFPSGTRFYIPNLQRYAIVEDLCGDGPMPQNGPCHIGRAGLPWVDIYVGGRTTNRSFVEACMRRITGIQLVVINPSPGYPVSAGEIAATGC